MLCRPCVVIVIVTIIYKVWIKQFSCIVIAVSEQVYNNASIPVLSAAMVSATTPLSACNAGYGSTRCTVASLVDRWTSGTTSAPGVKAIPGPMLWPLCSGSAPDDAGPGESSRSYCLFSPPGTSLLRYVTRYTRPESNRLCTMVAKRGTRTSHT